MKHTYLSIRAALGALGAICCAVAIPSISHAVGSVKVNGVQQCVSSTNMSLDPSGDLVISCNAPGTGPPPPANSPPLCNVIVSANSINVGGTATISAQCSPAADSWSWSTTNGGPTISGSSGTVTFNSAGSFTYTVTGTSVATGNGPTSAGNTVTVTVPPVGSSACPSPKPVTGPFPGTIARSVAIDRGNSVTWSLPTNYAVGKILEMVSSQTTSTLQGLNAQYSVSTCPGDFTGMQAECIASGGVETSGLQLYAAVSNAVIAGTCTVVAGQQYYLNVRNTNCIAATCYMNVHLNNF